MKVTIASESFPQVSETFVLNHVTSLIKKNIKVTVTSIYAPSSTLIKHEEYSKYRKSFNTFYEKKHKSLYISKLRYVTFLYDALSAFFIAPKVFVKLISSSNITQKQTYLSAFRHKKHYNTSDIIHAHFGYIGKRLTELKDIGLINNNIPIVCSFHGYDIDTPTYFKNYLFYKHFFEEVNLVISNSEYLKKRLIETGCKASKIEILKVGVDTNKFTPTATQKKRNSFQIITVARLIEVKGIEYGIKAIKTLVNKGYTDIKYNIIGDGNLYNTLRLLISHLKLNDHVFLHGPKSQEEIYNFYNNSNLFILPSIVSSEGRAETQGLVIQEAQSMELPIIVTDVGGIPEGIIPDETGFLVPEKSPEAIAEKIEYLILKPKIANEMGKRGREFVKNKFDLQIIGSQTIQLYNQLLDEQN